MCLPSPPKIAPPPPTPVREDSFAAGNKALQRTAGAKGFGSTILSGLAPDAGAPNPTPRKTLLGQ